MDDEFTRFQVCSAQLITRIQQDAGLCSHTFITNEDSKLIRMFLNRANFDVEQAFVLVQEYFRDRLLCHKIFTHYKMDSLTKGISTKTVMILPQISQVGTVIIFKVGAWSPEECSIYEISALLTLVMESVGLDEQKRNAGYSVIYDLRGVFLKQLNAMRPAVKVLKIISQSYLSSQCRMQLIANAMMPAMVTAMMNLVSFSKEIKNVPYPKPGDSQKRELDEIFGPEFVASLPDEYGGSAVYNWYECTNKIVEENLLEFAS